MQEIIPDLTPLDVESDWIKLEIVGALDVFTDIQRPHNFQFSVFYLSGFVSLQN